MDFNDYPSLEGSVFERMAEVDRRVLVVDLPIPDAPFSVGEGFGAWVCELLERLR